MKQKMGKSILDFLKSSKIVEFKSVSKQQFIHKVVSLRSKKFNSISFYNVCTRRKLLRNKCFLQQFILATLRTSLKITFNFHFYDSCIFNRFAHEITVGENDSKSSKSSDFYAKLKILDLHIV